MNKPVILTGLRANNDLHIGNYFGALLPLIDMAKSHADEFAVHLFVPDLHSFTTPIEHSQLQAQILHNLRLFVAAGLPLDNPSVHIYRQSYVPAHSELTWILDCFSSYNELDRMTQFKDKSKAQNRNENIHTAIHHMRRIAEQHPELSEDELRDSYRLILTALEAYDEATGIEVSVGLFNYPVLMAADILLYGAKYVPVGDDQTQHLEFTRDIAERMNAKFGELFVVPESVAKQHEFFGKEQGLRIKDLADPAKKMSKSDETGKGIIFLGDDPQAAAKKIRSATTDSFSLVDPENQDQPGIRNLLQILALASGRSYEDVLANYKGHTQYGPLKADTAAAVADFLARFQERLATVNDELLLQKLAADEAHMNTTANATLLRVQQAVGLRG